MALTKLKYRGAHSGHVAHPDDVSSLLVPGMIMGVPWDFGSTPPSGFLKCDGSAISRTSYSNLFANIGTTYGSGDGSTTFQIPDFRGKFLRGHGGNSESFGTPQSDRNKAESVPVWMQPHSGGGIYGTSGVNDYGVGAGRLPLEHYGSSYPDNYGNWQQECWKVTWGSWSVDTSPSANGGNYGKGYDDINVYIGYNKYNTSTNDMTPNPEGNPVNYCMHWVIKY